MHRTSETTRPAQPVRGIGVTALVAVVAVVSAAVPARAALLDVGGPVMAAAVAMVARDLLAADRSAAQPVALAIEDRLALRPRSIASIPPRGDTLPSCPPLAERLLDLPPPLS